MTTPLIKENVCQSLTVFVFFFFFFNINMNTKVNRKYRLVTYPDLCVYGVNFCLQESKTSKEELKKMRQDLKKMEEDHIRYTFLFVSSCFLFFHNKMASDLNG